MMVEGKKMANDAITVLEKHRASGFCLEEVMPEFFQADGSTGSQSTRGLSGSCDLMQLAETSLFLIANNLVSSRESMTLLRQIFQKNQRHLLADLFSLQLPTIQAFSCRIMESISETAPYHNGHLLLQDLLSCGLDRNLLAGPTGARCLQLAIYNKNTKLSLFLLRNGVQRNPKLGVRTPFDKTPIQLAKEKGEKDITQILLGVENQPIKKARAFEPYPKSEAERILTKACLQDEIEQIRALVAAGVDVDCDRGKDHGYGYEHMLDWTYFNKREYYEILSSHSNFAKKFLTASGLMSAASAGRKDLEQYLECRSWDCEMEYHDTLEDMIRAGMNYDLAEEVRTILSAKGISEELDAEELFMSAAQLGHIEIMAALAHGADVQVLYEARGLEDQSEGGLVSELIVDALFNLGDKSLERLLDFGWPFSLDRVFMENLELPSSTVKHFDSMPALKILVSRGLDLNAEMFTKHDDETYTPLHLAIEWGTPELVEYMIDAGAYVNSMASEARYSPLGEAIKLMDPAIVRLLLSKDADVHALADNRGTTLLELSVNRDVCRYQDEDDMLKIFQLLLDGGADINWPHDRAENLKWNTALTTAILNPDINEQISLALEAGADVHQQGGGEMARTPLQAAAEGGRIGIAKELLSRRADINAPAAQNSGRTALQAACENARRFPEMISFLLDAGAQINAPPAERFGRTAFQALCSSESTSTELASLLIQRGADIHAPAAKYGGVTALQGAAIAGNTKIVMILIGMDVAVNAPAAEQEGRMALDGAAEHGRIDIVQLLLNFRAACMMPGLTGYKSAISFAEENGHIAVADLLRNHICSVQGEIIDCSIWDDFLFNEIYGQ